MSKAVVLWTGGKDSALAFYRAQEAGVEIVGLATFIPADGSEFKAHPQAQITAQAESLGLPMHFLKIIEPYEQSYVEQLKAIRSLLGITSVITGDIDFVAAEPNWIVQCCSQVPLDVIRPLWQESRDSLLEDILKKKICARITWINHRDLPRDWIGRIIDADFIQEMKTHSEKVNFDLCGENGEYHTMIEPGSKLGSAGL